MVIWKGNNPRSWRTENQPHLVYSHILTDLGWSSATASSPRQNHWHQQDLCVVFRGCLLKGRYWGNLKKKPHLGLRLGDFFVVYQLLQGGGWTQCIYIYFTCYESSKQNSYILWCWTNVYIVWHPICLSLHIKEHTYLSSEKQPPVPFHPTMIDKPHKILITPLKPNMTLENPNFP